MTKLKALVEKRNGLLDELDTMASTLETEVRGMTDEEETRSAQLQKEIAGLDKAIKLAEQRKGVEEKPEEVREVEQNLEFEIRAVEQFLQRADGEEVRAVTAGAAPGQLTVPTNLSNLIVEKLFEVAALFSRTRYFTPVNGTLEILREKTIGTAGFVGEMNTADMTSDFTMDKVTLRQKRAGTAIELSQHLINDSGIDIVNYAVNLLSRRLGMTLDRNILVGTGDAGGQFEGMLGHADIINVPTAVAGTIGIDDLLDLYNSMNPEYLAGTAFVMHRDTFNIIAKFKDAENRHYLITNHADGAAAYKLFGVPVLIMDAMPKVASEAQAVLFANFGEAYATMIKKGLNMQHISGDTTQALRGSHLLLLDGYFDGKVLNPDAAKFLKVTKTA